MKEDTDEILKLVTGKLDGIRKEKVLSQITNDEESRDEYRKIKNAWALASSTKEMSQYQIEHLYLNFRSRLKKPARIISYSFLKYAAILIVVLSIGAAGFWSFYNHQKSYVLSSTIANSGLNGKSQLHLSNGTVVDLEKDNSKIALSGDKRITIDNEKVIDLNKTVSSEESKMNEVVVPFGKKSQLTLEDGTKIWLNAGSRMAFPTKFTGNKREVFLEGEGYFEVAHNPQIPFYVNTGEIAVKVLGTKFNISAYASDKLIETVLIEGKVALKERSAVAFLKGESVLLPNHKASYDRNDGSINIKDEPNVENAIAWTEGVFKFHRQSINDVLDKLQRYYNVQFVYSSEFPTKDLITGKLYLKDSIDQVMKTLDLVAKIQYRIEGNKIYIEKKTK